MSRNVKSAHVIENLYIEHKMSSRTIPGHLELCGGRGTRTHKSVRTTVFKLWARRPDSSCLNLIAPICAGQPRSQLPDRSGFVLASLISSRSEGWQSVGNFHASPRSFKVSLALGRGDGVDNAHSKRGDSIKITRGPFGWSLPQVNA
jgi:hypothetical protein